MPRQARLDAPGSLHHIIARGVGRGRIFRDRADYGLFADRLGALLTESGTVCYAWALMPNHIHLLLLTGLTPIKTLMSRLLTSYASRFNRRHKRSGHVFQNRYKSILCEQGRYLLELLRYIHLNPIKGGVVKNIRELEAYTWSGHAALLGRARVPWQDTAGILKHFSARDKWKVREEYRKFVLGALEDEEHPEYETGRVIRSTGSLLEYMMDEGEARKGDEAVLGSDEFIKKAISEAKKEETRRSKLKREGWIPPRIIAKAAQEYGIRPDDVYGGGKEPRQSKARSLACKWMVEDMGMKVIEVARILRVSQPAVSLGVRRGHRLASLRGMRMEDTRRRG